MKTILLSLVVSIFSAFLFGVVIVAILPYSTLPHGLIASAIVFVVYWCAWLDGAAVIRGAWQRADAEDQDEDEPPARPSVGGSGPLPFNPKLYRATPNRYVGVVPPPGRHL